MYKLDAFDRRLLYELDGNSRRSTSQLARSLRQGRDRVEYRLQRLKEVGILKRCTVTINPYKLGLGLYKTYLKLEKKQTLYEKVLEYLEKHPRVYWIADCDGKWDLIFSTFAKSAFEFQQIQRDIISRFASLIISSNVFTLVNVHMHRKGYLTGKGSRSFVVGGEPASNSIEKLEWDMLKLLSLDARLSLVQLAERLKTSEAVIRYRIEQLEKVGLIAGYRAELDLQKLGMMFFKAQIYLHNRRREVIEKIESFCEQHPNITYFIEQLGECDIEIELEIESYTKYTAILNELRSSFGSEIRNIETILINRSWFKWVPYDVAGT